MKKEKLTSLSVHLIVLFLCSIFLFACVKNTFTVIAVTPNPTPTEEADATNTPTNTPEPTEEDKEEPTSTPKPTAKPTVKAKATAKPTKKPTNTPKATETPTTTPTPTKMGFFAKVSGGPLAYIITLIGAGLMGASIYLYRKQHPPKRK